MAGTGHSVSSRESSSSDEDQGFSVAVEGNSSGLDSDSHDASDDESSLHYETNQAGFIDLEASEDEGSSHSGSTSDLDEGVQYSFPQFIRLPIELRRQIWEAFCPDLVKPARLYHFMVSRSRKSDQKVIWEHPHLDQQIEPTRTLLAVHQESRNVALTAFPDTLAIQKGKKIVHFNKDTDVVLLDEYDPGHALLTFARDLAIPGFSENIKHVAIDFNNLNGCLRHGFDEEPLSWANLETAYFVLDNNECPSRHLWWCPSRSANQYFSTVVEEGITIPTRLDVMYCWPNLKDSHEFAVAEVPRANLLSSATKLSAEFGLRVSSTRMEDFSEKRGVQLWPMIRFMGDRSMDRFDDLAVMDETKEYIDSDEEKRSNASDEDSGTDLDEYESDGIDDGDINDHSEDEDEDDLAVLPMSDDISATGDFSPLADHSIASEDVVFDAYPPAQFSSPEAESETARDIDSSDSDEAPARAARTRKRRAVTSSSDEESGDDMPRKRARIAGRRAAIASDDDENSEDNANIPQQEDGTSEEENSESESEDELLTARPMSLAERLQLNRVQNPITDSDDESSSSAVPSIRDYEDFQDDDQDNDTGDPGSEEEALSQDDLVDGQADESSDEGW